MQELQLQQKQGQITANELGELREACYKYGHFIRLGEASAQNVLAWYVLGHLPSSEAMIFRWTGERSADAFIPVAKSFTDWLASLLQHASP